MIRTPFRAPLRALAVAGAAALALSATALSTAAEAKSGSFKGQGRYKVSGKVTVVKSGGGHVLRLTGFRSTSGPDLYVYVGRGGPSRRIGRLRSTSGSQTYRLPRGVGPNDISSVHIHCRRFSSTFGTARLR